MSRLRSAQENVQAHRVDELEEIPVRGKKAGKLVERLGKTMGLK